jgi:hypothetical protein
MIAAPFASRPWIVALAAAVAAGCAGSSGGVQGTAIDTYEYGQPDATEVPVTTWTKIAADVVAGGKTFPGTLDPKGNLSIPGVPAGPYWLSLTSSRAGTTNPFPALTLIEVSAGTLDLGTPRTYRTGLKPMTKSSLIAINATLTLPWRVYTTDAMGNVTQPLDDSLQLVSRSTAVVGFYSASVVAASMSPPADKATSLGGWQVDALQAGAYSEAGNSQLSAAAKDQVVFLHNVAVQPTDMSQPAGSPWYAYQYNAVQEAFSPPPFDLTDGGTASVKGAFAAVAQKTFKMNVKGSAFAAAIADAPAGAAATFNTLPYMDVSLVLEAGTPTPGDGMDATLLDVTALSNVTYSNPACNPGSCDMTKCTTGCGTTASVTYPGDYQQSYRYGNPFPYGQELVVATFGFSNSFATLLNNKNLASAPGYVLVQTSASQASGAPLAPTIGLARSVTVAGQAAPVDKITSGVGVMPTIAFQPPSIGKPDAYQILVMQLDGLTASAFGTIFPSVVASIFTTATSVTIPAGVLQSGKHYYFRVRAIAAPGFDLAKPFAYQTTSASSQTYTGVVTP